ncbi:MAG: hypothetical protein ACE5KT_02255 [Methanosarcinales archaeon]
MFIAIPYSDYPFEDSIIEVLQHSGLVPILAKDKIESTLLLCKVCKNIRKCKYGVVDISKSNFNVIYELGLMQSLGKKCAILFLEGSSRPNDLQGIENIIYKNNPDSLKLELGKWIRDNVLEIEEERLISYLSNLAIKISGLLL